MIADVKDEVLEAPGVDRKWEEMNELLLKAAEQVYGHGSGMKRQQELLMRTEDVTRCDTKPKQLAIEANVKRCAAEMLGKEVIRQEAPLLQRVCTTCDVS